MRASGSTACWRRTPRISWPATRPMACSSMSHPHAKTFAGLRARGTDRPVVVCPDASGRHRGRGAARRLRVLDQPLTDLIAYRYLRKDGTYVWLEATSRAVRDQSTSAVVEIQVGLSRHHRAQTRGGDAAELARERSEQAEAAEALAEASARWPRAGARSPACDHPPADGARRAL